MGPLRQSICLQHRSVTKMLSFLFIQALHNDCSHIEDMHLLFCAHFMNIFSFLRGVELYKFFRSKCLECVWFV